MTDHPQQPYSGPSVMSHMGICVRNIEKSLAFYRDMLGMSIMKDEMLPPEDLGPLHLYELPLAKRRVVYLKYGAHAASPVLVITERPESTAGQPTLLDQHGISHLGFTIPNLQEFTERMLKLGAKPFGPTDSFRSPEGKVLSVFFSDPDGKLLQFDEALNIPTPARD